MSSKATIFRGFTDEELTQKIKDLKTEHGSLRIQKHAKGAEVNKKDLKKAKKDIARVMTIMQERKIKEAQEKYKNKKIKPYSLRVKLTKKRRGQLSPAQLNKKTNKEKSTIKRRKMGLFTLK